MKKLYIGWLLLVCLLFPLLTSGQDTPFHLDVPYVGTPEEVVEAMLDIAEVNKNDILYDLGCGDGRIVITAAKNKGARGVGIDINQRRIQESIENAKKANVMDKVRFIEQDLFIADISEATVVTLYLLPDVNIKLRPRLLHELKPGSRIVSHDFSMGEWEADKSLQIPDNFHSHTVYYWIVPANVTGHWEWDTAYETENSHYILDLNQQFQKVAGLITMDSLKIPIKEVVLTGDRIQFSLEQNIKNNQIVMHFDGKVIGNTLSGSVKFDPSSVTNIQKWTATRDPSTATSLDP